jgi:hypothetical protein
MIAEMLVRAWRQAAEDLAIVVRSPFTLAASSDGGAIECIALIEHFGSPNGTVVVGRHGSSEPARLMAKAQGRFFSLIDEASYSSYDRSFFIETLNDWGWFGELSQAPEWYTGQAWSSRDS